MRLVSDSLHWFSSLILWVRPTVTRLLSWGFPPDPLSRCARGRPCICTALRAKRGRGSGGNPQERKEDGSFLESATWNSSITPKRRRSSCQVGTYYHTRRDEPSFHGTTERTRRGRRLDSILACLRLQPAPAPLSSTSRPTARQELPPFPPDEPADTRAEGGLLSTKVTCLSRPKVGGLSLFRLGDLRLPGKLVAPATAW